MLQDEAPEVPLYATAYLNINDVDDTTGQPAVSAVAAAAAAESQTKTLRTCFTQPGVMPDFLENVRQKKVTRWKKYTFLRVLMNLVLTY